jgi:uncharacterized protein YbaA (DUF1428 family)
MPYVDGFVVPVQKKKLANYRRVAKKAARIWTDCGAVDVREWVADDVKPGKWTSFPRSVKLKRDETVVYSYILFKSRADRDKVNGKVMKDKRFLAIMNEPMPFDGKRMIYGGFKSLL